MDVNNPVKDIVMESAGAARVFEEMGIDYCCGGAMTLSEACRAAGRDPAEVIRAIEASSANSQEDTTDWGAAPASDLIGHIVQKHHAYCRRQNSLIGSLFEKVVQAHGARHPEFRSMQSLFSRMEKELSMHLVKEESVLFPLVIEMERAVKERQPIPQPAFGGIGNPIHMMIREHEDSGSELKEMSLLSRGYEPPDDACNATRSLFQNLKEFEQDMHRHIYLENYILFPRAEAMEDQLEALRASRR